jgi:hypothetical protein
MNNLPAFALSVRQPWAWAWAIIHAGKDIENRDWRPSNPGLRFRGRVAIHASKGMTRAEFADARDFMRSLGVRFPTHEIVRGAIIGSVEIVDVVRESDSPWFFGPRGLVLRDPVPCEPIPCSGALGFFRWAQGAGR